MLSKKFSLDIPKMGYFLLVKQPDKDGFVGRQIYSTQFKAGFSEKDSHYTHVEVLGGGQYSVRVAPPFTKVIDITKVYKGRTVKIVKYKGSDFDVKRYKVAFWASSNCNRKYDWWGAIKFRVGGILKKIIDHQEKSYFCSENSLWALQKEYPDALGIAPHECMPAHFLDTNNFELVFEGIIK